MILDLKRGERDPTFLPPLRRNSPGQRSRKHRGPEVLESSKPKKQGKERNWKTPVKGGKDGGRGLRKAEEARQLTEQTLTLPPSEREPSEGLGQRAT